MFILIIISLIICIVTVTYNKEIKYHPIILFNGIWLIIFGLYKLNFLNFLKLTDKTIIILLIMILVFPVGVITGMNRKYSIRLNKKKKNFLSEDNIYLRERLFFILCCISITILFVDEIAIIIKVLNGDSFKSVLVSASGKGTVLIQGAIKVSLYLFIINPVTYMISPITASLIMSNSNKKIKYFIINIILVALSVMHHGGRNAVFLMIISYILAFFIYGKKTRFKKRTKCLMIGFIIIVFILINVISKSRGIDSIWTSFYAYLTCDIPLMQLYIEKLPEYVTSLGGYLSFNGFIYPIMSIINFFGFSLPTAYSKSQIVRYFLENNYLSIGGYSHNMNAFVPVGGYFYIDGGFIFEIIGMFLYGVILGIEYERCKKYRDKQTVSIYILLSIGIILSFTKFWFTTNGYALALIYLIFIFKRDNKKILDDIQVYNKNKLIENEGKDINYE